MNRFNDPTMKTCYNFKVGVVLLYFYHHVMIMGAYACVHATYIFNKHMFVNNITIHRKDSYEVITLVGHALAKI